MNKQGNSSDTVVLGPRIVASAAFDSLYRDGMALVEEVAAYLDGQGRTESRALPRDASMIYATESMRLTTRLMQLASWLLLQRAVKEGELTADQAQSEKHRVNFRPAPPAERGNAFTQLPLKMQDLVLRGDAMYARIAKLKAMEDGEPTETAAPNPVMDQLERLQAEFSSRK